MTVQTKSCSSSKHSNNDNSTNATALVRGNDLNLQMSALMAMLTAAEHDDMEALGVAEKEAKIHCSFFLGVVAPLLESDPTEEGEIMIDLNRALTALAECTADEAHTPRSNPVKITDEYGNVQSVPLSSLTHRDATRLGGRRINGRNNSNNDAPEETSKMTQRSTDIISSDEHSSPRRRSLDEDLTRNNKAKTKEETAEELPLRNDLPESAPPALPTPPPQKEETTTRRHPDYVADAHRGDLHPTKTTDLLLTTTNELQKQQQQQHATDSQYDCASTVVSDLTMPTVATYCDPPDFYPSLLHPNNNNNNNNSHSFSNNHRMNSGWKMMNSRDTKATRKLGRLSAAELSRQVNERAGDEHVRDLHEENIYMHQEDTTFLKNTTPKKQKVIMDRKKELPEEDDDSAGQFLGLSTEQRSNTPQPCRPKKSSSAAKAYDNPSPLLLGKSRTSSSETIRPASAVRANVAMPRIITPPSYRRAVNNPTMNNDAAHADNDLIESSKMNTPNTATTSSKTDPAGAKLSTTTSLFPPTTSSSSKSVTHNIVDNNSKEFLGKNSSSKTPTHVSARHSLGLNDDTSMDSSTYIVTESGSKNAKQKKKKSSISNMLDGSFGRSSKGSGKDKKTSNSIPVEHRNLSIRNGKRCPPQQQHVATTTTITKRMTSSSTAPNDQQKEASTTPLKNTQPQTDSEDDLDTVVSTLGQDNCRELSVLEEEGKEKKRTMLSSIAMNNQTKEAGAHNTAKALDATCKIKYSLGSVASSLRLTPKEQNVNTKVPSATTTRDLYSGQEMRENGMSVDRTSQHNLMKEGGTRQSLEDVDERKSFSCSGVGSTTSSLTQSKALSCNTSPSREGPLLIDEDGFIIVSSKPTHVSNTVLGNDGDPDFSSFSNFGTPDFTLPIKKVTTSSAKHRISIDSDGFLLLSSDPSTLGWSNNGDGIHAFGPIKEMPFWWKDSKEESAVVNKDSRRPEKLHMEWALKKDEDTKEFRPLDNKSYCDDNHAVDVIDRKEDEKENKVPLSKRSVRRSETLKRNKAGDPQLPTIVTPREKPKKPAFVSARYQQPTQLQQRQQQYASKDESSSRGMHFDSQPSADSLTYTDETSKSPGLAGITRLDSDTTDSSTSMSPVIRGGGGTDEMQNGSSPQTTTFSGAIIVPPEGVVPVDLTASRKNRPPELTEVATTRAHRKAIAKNAARRSSRSLMSRSALPSIVETEEKEESAPSLQIDDGHNDNKLVETAAVTVNRSSTNKVERRQDYDCKRGSALSTGKSNGSDAFLKSTHLFLGSRSTKIKIGAVEADTKRRIEILRKKLVSDRAAQTDDQKSSTNGNANKRSYCSGDRMAFHTKLNLVEQETMKQIARLRRDKLSNNNKVRHYDKNQ